MTSYDDARHDQPADDPGADPGATEESTQDDEAQDVTDPGTFTEPEYDEGEYDPDSPPVGDDADDGAGADGEG